MAPAPRPEIGNTLTLSTPSPVPAVDYGRELEGARMLLRSGLLPDAIKTPESALFIILTGRDMGLSPVQSLRGIYVIKGKVEVSADLQLGLFHRAGGRSHLVTLTAEEAVLRLDASWLLEPHTESFTMEDARRANLVSGNYKLFPKPMLRSRAITAGLKSIGFDATAGMYAPGEIGGPEAAPDLPAPVSIVGEVIDLAQRPKSLKPLPPDPYAPIEDTGEAATEKQMLFLGKLLKSSVWTPDERHEYARRSASATVVQMMALLDEVIEEGKSRKARMVEPGDAVEPESATSSLHAEPIGQRSAP